MKELELIRWIRAVSRPGGRVVLGIGDDAAILAASPSPLVVTTDVVVEGTHFLPGDAPELVGRKALAVSLSDVAAMGCRPTAAFLAVAIPRSRDEAWVLGLFEGIRELAARFEVPLAGGDTTETAGPVVLCSTVLGEAFPGREPVRRSGARPGDALLVTGALGGSLAGRHLDFVPRSREAELLMMRHSPTAMIDVSDGLSTDARHLAEESGVTIRIEADLVPVAAAASRGVDRAGALGHAFDDGEDFELLFTLPPGEAKALEAEGLGGTRVTRIGRIGNGPAAVLVVSGDGKEEELHAGGFEHFG